MFMEFHQMNYTFEIHFLWVYLLICIRNTYLHDVDMYRKMYEIKRYDSI